MSLLLPHADGESSSQARRRILAVAKKSLSLLEAQLRDKGTRFFGGDSVGLVDIAASPLAHWLGVFEEVGGVAPALLSDEEHPALCRWSERYVDDEMVKQCLLRRDELVVMYSAACKDMFRDMPPAACFAKVRCSAGEAMPKRNKC
ncbi:probable glutathione S-transferase [Miscanthus floridulus]|uniref:probable glutathione S-transferase n=1 Tax=Miscanthus floridulus TaxID=154761 RepID=UPI00345B4739